MDFFGQMFVSNLFTIQLLHLCLREVLKYPSPLHIEAAAYLLHIAEPAVENHLHTFTLEPAGVLGRMRLGVYFDRIEDWCSMCHMDNEIFDWIMVGRLWRTCGFPALACPLHWLHALLDMTAGHSSPQACSCPDPIHSCCVNTSHCTVLQRYALRFCRRSFMHILCIVDLACAVTI